jgi:hypothetical protein
MAFHGGHDTQVALRKTAETRVTVSLAETFSGYPPTMDTLDLLQELNSDLPAQPLVQVDLLATQFQAIAYRAGRFGKHFVQIPLKFHPSPVKSED